MINFQTGIALLGLFLILFGVLYIIQNKRRIVVPEGFTTDYEHVDLSTIGDPITKIIKKISSMSAHFANPEVWKDAYSHSQMSLTDLARAQIAKDKKD
jgi:hypothetical protein